MNVLTCILTVESKMVIMKTSKKDVIRSKAFRYFKKWLRDLNKEIKFITWLDCVTALHSGKKVRSSGIMLFSMLHI